VGDLKINNQTAELATAQQASLQWRSVNTSGDSNEWQNIPKEKQS